MEEKKQSKINRIFEDEYLLVLDKPEGLIVNRSNTTNEKTLQDEIEDGYDIDDENEEFKSRSGIVHRLDKDTSGVLVVAKDADTFSELQKQFKCRKVKKEYLALVRGWIDDTQIEINAPIKRNPKQPLKYAVVSDGKEAVTFVEKVHGVELEGNEYTLIKVFPRTGRTHQIRVHMSAVNHFVAGDAIYSPANYYDTDFALFGRMMLHAQNISFKHPATGKEVVFKAEVPPAFQELLAKK